MPFSECSCGLTWWGKDLNSLRPAMWRCAQQHADPNHLELKEGRASLNTTLFCIASHRGCHYHDTQLSKQLLDGGVPEDHVIVKYGVEHGTDAAMHFGRRVGFNGVCHFSMQHRWMRAVSEFLQGHPNTTCVVYIENNVILEKNVRDILSAINQQPASKDVLWLAFIKIRAGSSGWNSANNPHHRPIIQGSKMIAFRGGGLKQTLRVLRRSRYQHLDHVLSKRISHRRIWHPRVSMGGYRGHWSTCSGHGKEKVWRPAFRVRQE